MKYNSLSFKKSKSAKRVGRGISAGGGKTAGRGTKGQKSRTGGSIRPGFEGGQNPLIRKIPKARGFKSIKGELDTVTTDRLQELNKTVSFKELKEAGMIGNSSRGVKVVLGKKPVEKAQTIKLSKISAGAKKAVEAAGGSFAEANIFESDKKK